MITQVVVNRTTRRSRPEYHLKCTIALWIYSPTYWA